MIGTIISLIFAIYLYFMMVARGVTADLPYVSYLLLAVGVLFVLIPPIVRTFMWSPLQNSEFHLSPHVTELYQKDINLSFTQIILLIFPLITFFFAIDLLVLHSIDRTILVPVWVLLLGISLDALYHMIKRSTSYLDPLSVVERFTRAARKNIQDEQELEFCNWIDALSEVGIRSIQRSSTSLCNHVSNEMQQLTRQFLESVKSISYQEQDKETKAMGISDKITYTLFYVLQRLEIINNKAAEQKLEPVCSNVVTVVGKIIVAAAKLDVSLMTYPLPFFGRFVLTAQRHGMNEVGTKATCLLSEVAKLIIKDIDLTYAELQEPFFTLINQLSEITKEMFRQDKNINIQLLKQPFQDLKALFQQEKMAAHPDAGPIIQRIDAALAEYEALETVLRTLPPVPAISP